MFSTYFNTNTEVATVLSSVVDLSSSSSSEPTSLSTNIRFLIKFLEADLCVTNTFNKLSSLCGDKLAALGILLIRWLLRIQEAESELRRLPLFTGDVGNENEAEAEDCIGEVGSDCVTRCAGDCSTDGLALLITGVGAAELVAELVTE